MSTFLAITDYTVKRTERILDLITADTDSLLDMAEVEAEGIINDRLSLKYDLTAEFAKSGANRNASLIRWMLAISLYVIYGRIPDNEVPERVVKDYDDTLAELEKISKGVLSCTLERIVDDEGEITSSRFRMGSSTPRTHDPFSIS